MPLGSPQFLDTRTGRRIAYHATAGSGPGVIFFGGFKSDMTGTKARAFEQWCRENGRAYVRFDYSGHGQSSGRFEEGTIGDWLSDALAVIDQVTHGSQIVIGSSMGGWLSLLATLARPTRVQALITLACATDFTHRLLLKNFNDEQMAQLDDTGRVLIPCDYDDQQPYPITRQLIEEGAQHLLLDSPIEIHCPVRLFHGMQDPDVPWSISQQTCQHITSQNVTLTLIKQGDHRLSEPSDLSLITHTLAQL